MRILIVSQYFWPENFRVNDLVAELCIRGHEVTVLTGLPNYPGGRVYQRYRRQPKSFVEYKGARIVRVPLVPRGVGKVRLFLNYVSFALSACFWGPLFLGRTAFDVVFVYAPSPIFVCLPAIVIGKLKRAPVTLWVLDLWPDSLVAVGATKSRWVLASIGLLVRFLYSRCTLILGQSNSFVESIARYCDDALKIRYFPSWSEDFPDFNDLLPAPEIPFREDIFTILFTGNIGEAQDMPSVLRAAEMLKNNNSIRWVLVGGGRKLDWVRSEVVRRNLQNCVLVPGEFSSDRMPSFLLHADALLLPLKSSSAFHKTIPAKLQFYLSSRLPILAMLDGEAASTIRQANGGLVSAAGDSEGLVKAVLKMVGMTGPERRRMGLAGRSYYEQEFDRTLLMDRLEGFLRDSLFRHR